MGARDHFTFTGLRALGRWPLRSGLHERKLGQALGAAAVAMASCKILDHWGAFMIEWRRLAMINTQTGFTELVLTVSRLPPGGRELLVFGLFQYPFLCCILVALHLSLVCTKKWKISQQTTPIVSLYLEVVAATQL